MTTTLLLALSITLDSLWVGISYGMKKIKLTLISVIIMISISGATLSATWMAGQIILQYIPVNMAKTFGSIMLILTGCIFIIQALLDNEKQGNKMKKTDFLSKILNIFIHPSSGDLDNSGIIEANEALLLAIALSVDAFSIGFTLAAYGINLFLFLLLTSSVNIIMLKGGENLGKKISALIPEKASKFISGITIIMMGIIKLI
ncbi:MAG: manganese efflux pump [Clostridia bacterium]|nr:manganese efflux pump [Clostridia bacterium]